MKNFLDWFKKPKDNDTEDTKYNILIVSVDSDGKIFLNFDVNNFSDKNAENFGMMLYYLNEGMYVETILDLFLHFMKNDNRFETFTQDTIRTWSKLVNEFGIREEFINNKNTDPIIAPSDFYNKTEYKK
ncbi:MAG: hypothetical protein ACKO7N_01655 [Candidatus Nitrosotenuis sp.]